MKFLFVISIILFSLFISCTATKKQADKTNAISNEDLLTQYYWKLVALRTQTIKSKGAGKNIPHLLFQPENKEVKGFAGCNQLSGQYTIAADNQLKLERIITTRKSCFAPTIEQEFLKVLEMVDSYTLVGNTLKLYKAEGLLATFEGITLEKLQKTIAPEAKSSILWVNSSKTDCGGLRPKSCFQIQRGKDIQEDAWEYLYSDIKGFNYEAGHIYKLRVKIETIKPENVPADASAEKIYLVEVLSKKIDQSLRLHDIWLLQQMNGKDVRLIEDGRRPLMEIHLNKREILGKGGCNSFFGAIKKLTAQEIQFGGLGNTGAICPNQAIEDQFFQGLDKVRQYTMKNGRLSLFDEAGLEVLVFKKID